MCVCVFLGNGCSKKTSPRDSSYLSWEWMLKMKGINDKRRKIKGLGESTFPLPVFNYHIIRPNTLFGYRGWSKKDCVATVQA